MKKMLAVLTAMFLLLTAAALAETADLTGEWYLQQVLVEDVVARPGPLRMSMTLNADGTAETSDGTAFSWALTDGALTVTGAEDIAGAAYAEGQITLESALGVLVFGREPLADFPEVIAAESEEAFDGEWQLTSMNVSGILLPAEAMDSQGSFVIGDGTAVMTSLEGADEDPLVTQFDAMFSDGLLVLTDADEAEDDTVQHTFSLLADGTAEYCLSIGDFAVITYYERVE